MAKKIILYIAMSLDGYIAKPVQFAEVERVLRLVATAKSPPPA